MSSYQQELLFDLIESEADVLYYIRDAEFPALVITQSPVGHFPRKRGDRYTLWFGRGIERWSFKTLKEAEAKAEEILNHYTKDAQISVVYPRRPRKNRTFEVHIEKNKNEQ